MLSLGYCTDSFPSWSRWPCRSFQSWESTWWRRTAFSSGHLLGGDCSSAHASPRWKERRRKRTKRRKRRRKRSWWPPVTPCPDQELGRWQGRKTPRRATRSSNSSPAGGERLRHNVSVSISTLYWNSRHWKLSHQKEHTGRVRPGARQRDSWRWWLLVSSLWVRIWPEASAPTSITPRKGRLPVLAPSSDPLPASLQSQGEQWTWVAEAVGTGGVGHQSSSLPPGGYFVLFFTPFFTMLDAKEVWKTDDRTVNKTQSGWGGGAGRHLRPSAVGTFWSFSAESQPAGHLKSVSLWSCQNWRQLPRRCCFLLLPFSFWWCLLMWSLPKATSSLGGGWRLVFCLALPSTSKSLGKPLVNRLKPGV